jgi:hypothetical protein
MQLLNRWGRFLLGVFRDYLQPVLRIVYLSEGVVAAAFQLPRAMPKSFRLAVKAGKPFFAGHSQIPL